MGIKQIPEAEWDIFLSYIKERRVKTCAHACNLILGCALWYFLLKQLTKKKKKDEKFFLRNLCISQNQQSDDNLCKSVAYAEFQTQFGCLRTA